MLQKPPTLLPDRIGRTSSNKRLPTSDLPAWVLVTAKPVDSANAASDRPTPLAPDDLLTLSEVAQYLRVSTRTVSRMIKSGRLPAKRVGGGVRIKRSQLMVMLTDLPQIPKKIGDRRE